MEETAVENDIELPVEPGVENVILLPGDFDPLLLRLFPRQADGRFGNIGRRHSESSASEFYSLSAGAGTEVERAPASQPEFIQRIFEVVVQFRIEPGHGFDLSFLIQLLPMWELMLFFFGQIHPRSLRRPNRRRQPIDLNACTKNQSALTRFAIPCCDPE